MKDNDKIKHPGHSGGHSGGKSSGIKTEKYTKKHISPKKLFVIAAIVITAAIILINMLG